MDLKKTSLSILSWHVYIWKMTGLYPMKYTTNWKKYCHYCFCIILHGSFTFYYAFSITFQSFLVTRIKDLLANIFISATFIAIFIKLIVIRKNSSYFTHILELSCEFEEKYKESKFAQEQQKIFKRKTRTYFDFYLYSYTVIIILKILSVSGRSLLYEAYFPFDPLEGDLRYGAIMFYQTIGWLYMGYINVFADSYPTILIYLLTNDMNILGDQISQIGNDDKENAYEKLRDAIKDRFKMNEFFEHTNKFLSPAMLTMFAVVFINLVLGILLATFYSDNKYEALFLVLFAAGSQMEISLPCLYGSEYIKANEDFLQSLYACNWVDQSKNFKKDLQILTEICLQEKEFLAGGLFPISLITFSKIIKSAYSFYTVLSQMTN